jgi:choline-sulfatase
LSDPSSQPPRSGARSAPSVDPSRIGRLAEICALALGPSLLAALPTALRTRAAGGGALDGWLVGTAVWLTLLLPFAWLRHRAARGWRGLTGADPPRDLGVGIGLWVGLSVSCLLLLGAMLKLTTHHRALGGTTFAVLGVGAVGLGAVFSARLLTLGRRLAERGVPRRALAAAALVIALGPPLGVAISMLWSPKPLGADARATSAALFDLLLGLAAAAVWLMRGLPAAVRGPARVGAVPLAACILAIGLGRAELSPDTAQAVRAGGGLPAVVLGVLERWSDRDHDGYGSHFGGRDCDEGDPRRHPGAVRSAGDPVDLACEGTGDLAAPAALAAHVGSPTPGGSTWATGGSPSATRPLGPGSAGGVGGGSSPSAAPSTAAAVGTATLPAVGAPAEHPDLVLVTLDTVAAGHCSLYGYGRDTTPNLGALARRGVLFVHAYAAGSSTQLAITPLVTGRTFWNSRRGPGEWPSLVTDNDTVAERLKRVGYATAAVTSFTWLRKDRGFDQGFDTFDETPFRAEHPERSTTGPKAVEAARQAYDQLKGGSAPIFLWIHLFDAHAKYLEHEGVDFGRGEADRYDGEIAFVDRLVGELVAVVDAGPRASRTLWLVHGSNGEGFGEHAARGHGNELYDEMIRVPMVAAGAGVRAGRYEAHAVSTLDIAATLLDVAGAARDSLDGVSLRPVLGGDLELGHPPVVALAAHRTALVDWPLKLLVRRRDGPKDRLLLFDLGADPGEQHDLAAERKADAERLDTLRRQADQGVERGVRL